MPACVIQHATNGLLCPPVNSLNTKVIFLIGIDNLDRKIPLALEIKSLKGFPFSPMTIFLRELPFHGIRMVPVLSFCFFYTKYVKV